MRTPTRLAFSSLPLVFFAAIVCAAGPVSNPAEHDDHDGADLVDPPLHAEAESGVACGADADGSAAGYPCAYVDLESLVPLHELGAGEGDTAADLWGWRDPKGGKEYAIVGLANGTSFVDVSNPRQPRVVAFLPTATIRSPWRELKVYANTAFIIADSAGQHGLQIVKLDRLRAMKGSEPVTIGPSAVYSGFGSAHNIEINPQTGVAYVVGSSACGGGGILMLDVRKPGAVRELGCNVWPGQEYVHDIVCELYRGPDARSRGREICFASAADAVWILDVTDKANPRTLSRTDYAGRGYVHQGWLTEDHAYFLLDDELDETRQRHGTRTYLWDVHDLEAPLQFAVYESGSAAIDHNQYVRGKLVFQANYHSGLRILDVRGIGAGELQELAFFDVSPQTDDARFGGAWGVYPFLPSGNVLVSAMDRGLFVLRPGTVLRKLMKSTAPAGR